MPGRHALREIPCQLPERFLIDKGKIRRHGQVHALVNSTWSDPRLSHHEVKPQAPTGPIWEPQIDIINAPVPPKFEVLDLLVDPDGTVHRTQRVTGLMSTPMALARYPFDDQKLRFTVQPNVAQAGLLKLEPGSLMKVRPDAPVSMSEWTVHGITHVPAESPYLTRAPAGIRYFVQVQRRPMYYIALVFTRLLILVAVSWVVFWVPPNNLQSQITIALSTSIATVAFGISLSSTLPRVPYVTFLDAFNLLCFTMIFLSMAEIIAVHRRYSSDAVAGEKARRRTQFVFPLLFLTGTVGLLIYYFVLG